MSVKYPVGIQTFSNIIEGGFKYVDKTALIYQLINDSQYVFLSRPRRFGKSLLLTTIQAYFEGRRELFDGLAMSELEKEWKQYPVILLSLSKYNPNEPESLYAIFDIYFQNHELRYGITDTTGNLSTRFHQIITEAYRQTGEKVVILIDEYDAPLVAHLGEDSRHEEVRNLLKSVYVNIKEMDAYIRFAMLTGVSRFSKVTIFSGLNNLKDITLLPKYNNICGITHQELIDNFEQGISNLAQAMDTDYEGAITLLKNNYDGYHFTSNLTDIYNPFSLINALDDSRLGSYWFASGTPTFLIKHIRRNPGLLSDIFNRRTTERTLADIDSFKIDPVPLMFQTGYLTIKSYDKVQNAYRVGIPNREVEEGLFNGLLEANLGDYSTGLDSRLLDIREKFYQGDIDEALRLVQSILADIPYSLTQNKPEIYFENNLYLIFKIIGIRTRAEWQTSRGRIDMLLETPNYIYVMELKLDGTPAEALAQIESREYAIPFSYDGRHIIKVGINFSATTRNIDSWLHTLQ